ncbi:MAG: AAA family ATPase [Pseudomonadales bacterium]|nr:AAA family ATPase [Pseudomonadales bacterium]
MTDVLLQRQITMLVAPGGTGKSTLSLMIALSVASGIPLLGKKVLKSSNVLMLNNEDDEDEQKRRYWAISSHHAIIPTQKIYYFKRNFQLMEGNELSEDGRALINEIRQRDIGLLIIDPLLSVNTGDENSNQAAGILLNALGEIARGGNCSILLIHHTRKFRTDESAAGNAATARGASAFVDRSRICLTLSTMNPGEATSRGIDKADADRYIQLRNAKSNYSKRANSSTWLMMRSIKDPSGENIAVHEVADLNEPEIFEISPETVAKRLLECMGEGSHPQSQLRSSYCNRFAIKDSTVGKHLALIGESKITIEDHEIWKTKEGTAKNSPATIHIKRHK